uniref:Retrovirus-related Pol polyprotein from transposon TNT 1-94 n=1 Tax=Cajanus cajan TaxID=3821 RepID=A0A151QNG8_CAJCA|nr:Retrovirus-related Pol polyprotein from transposon TNT 1-94 [Cajanus cajan]
MANNNLPYGEGVSIHRPPVFNGENYVYWKIRMRIFIEAIDIAVWDAIENGPYIPMKKDDDGELKEKHWSEWSDEEKKRAQHDKRAKNIITSALSIDEFFRISQCISAKEMWDTLQVTHEGTSDVKRSRKHTLIREYELFRMQNGESISCFQKRFPHLINHLVDLGRKFEKEELNLKVLQCLDRTWKAKVTAIEESKDLTSLTLATFFGKLREHEQKKFIRRKKNSPYEFNKKTNKKEEASTSSFNCFECGKPGHMKAECPNLLKKQQGEKKFKKNGKGKKAYIAWEDNDSNTLSDESKCEKNNLCLMAGTEQDTIVSDSDLESNLDYDQLQEAFIQIHEEAVKLGALNSKLKNKLKWYENALIKAEQELEDLKCEHENRQTMFNFSEALCENSTSSKNICQHCKIFEKENVDLKSTLAKFTNGNANLNILLGKQRNTFDKSGLGFNANMSMPFKSKKEAFVKNQNFRKFKSNSSR